MKTIIGLVFCLVILGAAYFGFGTGNQTPKKEAIASVKPAAQAQKPIQAMNLALGDMVFLAQDLGFSIKSQKDFPPDSGKITLRLESHLQRVRELYRHETVKNPNLIGSVLLQFNISPAGEVSQIKELSSRVNDADFKNAVIAEVAKWSFADVVSENLTVTCPLLFVREGMDITTLVLWEKSLANLSDAAAQSRQTAANGTTKPQPKAPAAIAPLPAAVVNTKSLAPSAIKADASEFQIKYPTLLRKDPNFSSNSLTTFTIGTKVTLVKRQGDWLEVRAGNSGPTGFIRKEFVKQIEVAQQ
jgi:hypothetical protein